MGDHMVKADLLLLHPPNVYDFRSRFIHFGPISDGVPPTPIFEMYPLGFVSLLTYLSKRGWKVRIFNLALKMLNDPKFDVEGFLRKLNVKLIGLDLHWLIHCHGCFEIAKLIKKYHPNTPIVLGGLSATYYYREIMENYPQVDFIIRGDSAEKPLDMLMERLEKRASLDSIPNLVWRDGDKIKVNPFTYVPNTLDDYVLDYSYVVKSVLSSLDLEAHKPFKLWEEYPCTSVFVVKGCLFNCAVCGGARCAYERFYNRLKPAFKKPEQLAYEISSIAEYVKGPIYVIGEPRQKSLSYAEEVLNAIKSTKVDNPIIIELFYPASSSYLRKIRSSTSRFGLQISPETHDDELRLFYGRTYRNKMLEACLEEALKLDITSFDIFFTIGIPFQTQESIGDTLKFIDYLLGKYGSKLNVFVLPVAPYVDPGSPAFENPARYGYRIIYRSLEEHRRALEMPCWLHWLNFESLSLPKIAFSNAIYAAGIELNLIKLKYGILNEDEVDFRIRKIYEAKTLVDELSNRVREGVFYSKKDIGYREAFLNEITDGELFSKRDFRINAEIGLKKLSSIKLLFKELCLSFGHKYSKSL